MTFLYGENTQRELETAFTPDRLTAYMTAAGGDLKTALRLYTWNSALSSAFYSPLQGLEIALRNTMHRELTNAYGTNWYDNSATSLTQQTIQRITNVKENIRKSGKPVDPPHIVAELSFGFWVTLLGAGPKDIYSQKLWRPALHKAFPNKKLSRKQAHAPLNHLRIFRNRIAHHEPIFRRHLKADYTNILNVTGWISKETQAWLKYHSRVESVLNRNGRSLTNLFHRIRAAFKENF